MSKTSREIGDLRNGKGEREMEKLKDLKEEHKITGNQFKGILLEIATYQALEHLGIKPIPLHNPFNKDYVKDYHLGIDLIFYHNNLLFGVECKNLSPKGYLAKEWIKQEIEKLQEEVSSLQKKKIQSLDLLDYVSSSAYVEDQARIELNMKKPGEKVLFVNKGNFEKSEAVEESGFSDDGQFLSNPVKWLYYFIHKPL